MPHRPARLRLVSLCVAPLVGAGLVFGAGVAQAEPDIASVEKKLDGLYHEAEQAQERLHDVTIELRQLNREIAAVDSDREQQAERVDESRSQLRDSIVRRYEGEGLGAIGQVIVADDPAEFLSQMSTKSSYDALQSSLLDGYANELKALQIRQDTAADRADRVAAAKERLAAEEAVIDEKVAEAEELLEELEAEERAALMAGQVSKVPADIDASGRAKLAIDFAMAQVGKRYSYGASGPDAFDCSGLTSQAWARAGVALPRSSGAQFAAGRKVAAGDLRPGDLVYYYTPISHVGMYIGNGMIVHAANPRTGVQVTGLYSMPYVGATRPG